MTLDEVILLIVRLKLKPVVACHLSSLSLNYLILLKNNSALQACEDKSEPDTFLFSLAVYPYAIIIGSYSHPHVFCKKKIPNSQWQNPAVPESNGSRKHLILLSGAQTVQCHNELVFLSEKFFAFKRASGFKQRGVTCKHDYSY